MRTLVLLLALVLGASAVRADNGIFYVGAGISRVTLSDIVNSGPGAGTANLNGTSWKLDAGLRPMSALAIEADYLDLGSQTGTFFQPGVGACPVGMPNCAVARIRADARAFAAYGVGFLPTPLSYLEALGKAGLARWNVNNSSSPPTLVSSFPNSSTQFAWGVGTQAHFGNLGARLEYENFRIPGTKGADVVSLEAFLNLY